MNKMQAWRDFWRFHFLKTLLVLVVIQLAVLAWLQVRNHKPIAVIDEVYVTEGQFVKIYPLRNDTDKDEDDLDSLQLVSFESPMNGRIERNNSCLVFYAEYGFSGIDSFTYVLSDGKKDSKPGYVKVEIEKNKLPIAKTDFVQMYVGNTVNLAVLSNDVDEDEDSIFIAEFSQPLHGKIMQQPDGFIYEPNSNKALVDSFYYVISDGFNVSERASVIIDVKDKTHACYPWLNADIGNVQQKGTLRCAGGKIKISASGDDVWFENDGFNFTYQEINGDFELITKLNKLDAAHEWAKAGIMVRENLSANSKNVFALMSLRHGAVLQIRDTQGAYTQGVGTKDEVESPSWIKLVRVDNDFKAYLSTNGNNWKEYGLNDNI